MDIRTERVDDVPLLIAQMNHMGLGEILDEVITAHGNWEGLTIGEVVTGWLGFILTSGDHRLNQVEAWAESRETLLQQCLAEGVRPLDFSDDRLARVLTLLGKDDVWDGVETQLTQRLVRVYDLTGSSVRVDSTTTSGYWEVTPEGLFQFGPSKDHRPDLPQVKVMLSTLDPLGLPIATQVVGGQRADDRLYMPAIREARQGLQRQGLLYVADVKGSARNTRAFVHAGGDYYLVPLGPKQLPKAGLATYLAPVWRGEQPLTPLWDTQDAAGLCAAGFEVTTEMQGTVGKTQHTWSERRLVIYSEAQFRSKMAGLERRLAKAEATLAAFNVHKRGKSRPTTVASVAERAQAVLTQHQVAGLLDLTYTEETVTTARGTVLPMIHVMVRRNDAAIRVASAEFGWRVYATNQPAEQLSWQQAVVAYRRQFRIEHRFADLKGRALSLRPLYLQDEQRVKGLLRLLVLGLRVLTLLSFQVRTALAATGGTLVGLYSGNPKRATAQPTAARLLAAFKEITLTMVTLPEGVQYHLTPLTQVQERILTLLDLPIAPYARLVERVTQPGM